MSTTPFNPTGLTVRITAGIAGSLPTPLQAVSGGNVQADQYVVTNTGSNPAWLSWGQSASEATANCVVPVTGTTGQKVYPLLNGSQITLTLGPNFYFCAITSTSTSTVDITPGYGQ